MAKQFRRHAAILTAAMLVSAVTLQALPDRIGGVASTESVLHFAELLRQTAPAEEQYTALRFSPEQSLIFRDGKAVGTEFAGFCMQDGQTMVSRSQTETAAERAVSRKKAESGEAFVTLEEAAAKIGCEIHEENGETIVESPFQSASLLVQADQAFDSRGAVSDIGGYRNLHVLQYETPADAYAAYLSLQEDSAVLTVEPNRTVCAAETEGDYGFIQVDDRWGIDAIGADSYREWLLTEKETLPEIKVAVIDTGIYAEHSWFEGRIADGGTGFTYDEHGSNADGHSHGTHCAGIICMSTTDNVKILALKSLSNSGYGSLAEIYCAMEYALEQNADVVSMSLGGLGFSPLMTQAVDDLYAAGIPCVVAAGNESMEAVYSHPANASSAITVSAIGMAGSDESDTANTFELADFSNFGDMIDFGAPGVDIESAGIYGVSSTTFKSGTSMATPFVAACVADLLSYDKNMSNDDVYEYLKRGALDLGEPGFDPEFGWGMVNLAELRPSENYVAPPVPSLLSGSYNGMQPVSFTCSEKNAEIYYTLDGTEPSVQNGLLYSDDDILITDSCVLKAVAVSGSGMSAVVTRQYSLYCNAPLFSVQSGAFSGTITVELETDTLGAKIYYTTDGTDPSAENGKLYTGKAVSVSQSLALKAVSVVGSIYSPIAREDYLINGKDVDGAYEVKNGVLTAYHGVATAPDLSDLNITAIGEGAFRSCPRLMTVILPDTVTTIGSEAFANCAMLSSVTGRGVTQLGRGAFRACEHLWSVKLGAVTKIPAYAFYECFILSDTVGFENVTQVNDYAFYHCYSLGYTTLDFTKLRSIGSHAFANNWIPYELHLDSLQSLGDYAFMDVDGVTAILLPETMTVLPEGAFYDFGSTLCTLSLPGITEVGAFAMCFNSYSLESPDLGLNAEKITRVGESAFESNVFLEPPVFSSLTEIGKHAFFSTAADSLSFPAVKTLETGSLSGVIAKAVYLEHVEHLQPSSLETGGQFYSSGTYVILGDDVETIENKAIKNLNYSRLLISAPEDSPAKQYAEENDYAFLPSPAVAIDADSLVSINMVYEVYQYTNAAASAIPLGFDLPVIWYQCDDTEKNGAKKVSAGTRLDIDTSAAGETYFYAAVERGDQTVCESDVLPVSVLPVKTVGALTEADAYTIIDIKDYMPDTQTDGSFSVAYTLRVSQDESYQLFCGNYNMANVTVIGENGSEWGAYDEIPLKAGSVYTVIVTFLDVSYSPLNVLYIHKFSEDWSGFYSVDVYSDSAMYEYNGKPIEPELSVYNGTYIYDPDLEDYVYTQVEMVLNQDYKVIYRGNDGAGTGIYYVYGIGRYAGLIRDYFRIYEPIAENQPLEAKGITRDQAAYYAFTPAESGTYRIYSQYSDSLIDGYISGEKEYLYCDTCITLYDSSMQDLITNDDYGYSSLSMIETELQKGTTYYFGISSWGDRIDAVIGVTRKSVLLDAFISAESTTLYYNAAPQEPKPEVYHNGTLLTENKDYKLRYANNTLPGLMTVFVIGIGDYCGIVADLSYTITFDLSDEDLFMEIEPDQPFEISNTVQICTVYVNGGGKYHLQAADALPFSGSVMVHDYFWDEWYTLSDFSDQDSGIQLSDDTYYLLIRQDSEETREFTLVTDEIFLVLSAAEVEVSNAYYTGKPVMPEVKVWFDGELLREGIDYELYPEDDMISCGYHQINIIGIGDYSGSYQASFMILPPPDAETEALQIGTNTAQITAGAQTVFFSWTPEKSGSYCFCCEENRLYSIHVYDSELMMTFALEGIGLNLMDAWFVCGEEYLVTVSFSDVNMTGSLPFRLLSDYTLLRDSEITYDEMVAYHDGSNIPAYTVTAGGRTLTEGVDYAVRSIGLETQPGRAEIELIGLGSCLGTRTFSYYIYPEVCPDGDPIPLALEDPYSDERSFPGTQHLFSFKAPHSGTYYLYLPDSSYDVYSFVYGSDGAILPHSTKSIMLESGEKISILCITDWLSCPSDTVDPFTISVSETAPRVYYYSNGVSYVIEDGYAYVDNIDSSYTGIEIPDYVYSETDDVGGEFGGFIDWASYEIQNGYTVYGINGGVVYDYCVRNGICFAGTDPQTTIAGDITGDGMVNRDDALTLIRWLGEGIGMQMSDQAYANADFNGDGYVDLRDVRAIQLYIIETAVG